MRIAEPWKWDHRDDVPLPPVALLQASLATMLLFFVADGGSTEHDGRIGCVAATVVARAELNPGVSSDSPDLGRGLTRAQVEMVELPGEPDWGLHPRSIRPEGPETGVAGCVERAERRVLVRHRAPRGAAVNCRSAWSRPAPRPASAASGRRRAPDRKSVVDGKRG